MAVYFPHFPPSTITNTCPLATDNDPNVNVSQSQQHQDGIDHITGHSAAGGSAPAPSNPGSDDPTGGIASGHGGVSSTAFVHSPVPHEQHKSYVQSTVDTVRSYLPASLAGLSLGGGSSAAKDASASDARDAKEDNNASASNSTSGGYLASAAAATSATTAAVVGSSATSGDSVKQGSTTTSSSLPPSSSGNLTTAGYYSSLSKDSSSAVNRDETMADAAPQQGRVDPSVDTSMTSNQTAPQQGRADPPVDSSMPSGTNPRSATADPTDATPSQARTAPDSISKPDEQPRDEASSQPTASDEAEGGDEKISHAKQETWPKENREAIPTAGGERLGEKHWGESDIVPDAGKPQTKENISSSSGQPDGV